MGKQQRKWKTKLLIQLRGTSNEVDLSLRKLRLRDLDLCEPPRHERFASFSTLHLLQPPMEDPCQYSIDPQFRMGTFALPKDLLPLNRHSTDDCTVQDIVPLV